MTSAAKRRDSWRKRQTMRSDYGEFHSSELQMCPGASPTGSPETTGLVKSDEIWSKNSGIRLIVCKIMYDRSKPNVCRIRPKEMTQFV